MTGILKKYIDVRLKSEGDGEVAERLMAPLSKSGILSKNGIVGSNPTLSAKDLGLNDDPLFDSGEMSERLKEHDWKSCALLIAAPRVQIPLSPPVSHPFPALICGVTCSLLTFR